MTTDTPTARHRRADWSYLQIDMTPMFADCESAVNMVLVMAAQFQIGSGAT